MSQTRWVHVEYFGGVAEHYNPKPFYSYYMSAYNLCAVYKAKVAVEANRPLSFLADALNYASKRGLVFG